MNSFNFGSKGTVQKIDMVKDWAGKYCRRAYSCETCMYAHRPGECENPYGLCEYGRNNRVQLVKSFLTNRSQCDTI